MRVQDVEDSSQVSINGGAFNVTAPFGGTIGTGERVRVHEWRSSWRLNQFS